MWNVSGKYYRPEHGIPFMLCVTDFVTNEPHLITFVCVCGEGNTLFMVSGYLYLLMICGT